MGYQGMARPGAGGGRVIPESRFFEVRPVELRAIVRRVVKRQSPDEIYRMLRDGGQSADDANELTIAIDEAYNRVCAPVGRR
jgi:hypothetical protein